MELLYSVLVLKFGINVFVQSNVLYFKIRCCKDQILDTVLSPANKAFLVPTLVGQQVSPLHFTVN